MTVKPHHPSHAIPAQDEKSNILFNQTWSKLIKMEIGIYPSVNHMDGIPAPFL